MQVQLEKARAVANFTRFRGEKTGGHYESYFMRANDAASGTAFWIRYTIYQGEKGAGNKEPMGELWAIWFEKGQAPVAATTSWSPSSPPGTVTVAHKPRPAIPPATPAPS